MSFPETRHTLIQRLAAEGTEAEWREFLTDYWMPVCRFARFQGNLQVEDAEDVASQTFEVVLKNKLLARWGESKTAKLRTLLCGVVRNLLANRVRVLAGRSRILRERAGQSAGRTGFMEAVVQAPTTDESDVFYAAWVEEILRQTVEGLLQDYNRVGKGDYFRTFYGRLCEEMPMQEIAAALGLPVTTATNYYHHARTKLAEKLREVVLLYVQRYSPPAEANAEFVEEWKCLGNYLTRYGGLEQTVRLAYAGFDSRERDQARAKIAASSARFLEKP